MAYRDINGNITIDEIAAQKDIESMSATIQRLQSSRRSLGMLRQQASICKGETVSAIVEKSYEIEKEINVMIGNLDEAIEYIKRTVAHYKKVDQEVKDIINRSNGGGGGSW